MSTRTNRLASAAGALCLALATLAPAALAPLPTATADDATQCRPGITNYVSQRSWTDSLLGVDSLRALSQGADVTVAVIDSGVSVINPHLQDVVLPGIDLTGGGNGNGLTDHYGHGTAVAGIIAARHVDGSSLQGVAPQAKILPVRVFDTIDASSGAGAPSLDVIAQGIRYAADQHAQVINVSMSNLTSSHALEDAVDYATGAGSLVVASAGNRSTSSSTKDGPRYPASLDPVLGVAASDTAGHASDDSVHGKQVDVLAPGMQVLTTVPQGVDCVYATQTASSSYATAYASAVAALVASAHPDETPAQWKLRIEATGNRPDPDSRDDSRGWGMVNPRGAVTVELADGLRGPDIGLYKPYVAWDDASTILSVKASQDTDAPTRRLITVVAVVCTVIVILLLAHAKARTDRRRAQADGKTHAKDARESAGPGSRRSRV